MANLDVVTKIVSGEVGSGDIVERRVSDRSLGILSEILNDSSRPSNMEEDKHLHSGPSRL